MDKYQLALLGKGTIKFVSENGEERIEVSESATLYQNMDYRIGNYKIVIENPSVEAVTYLGNKFTSAGGLTNIPFDFNNPGKELTISFKNGLADDCVLPLTAQLADKTSFDEKLAKRNQKELVEGAALTTATGIDLINVFWKKTNSSVDRCVIKIEYRKEEQKVYLVKEVEAEGEFLSVTGLAHGDYVVTLSEYSGKTLIVSVNELVTIRDTLSEIKDKIKESAKTIVSGGRQVVIG